MTWAGRPTNQAGRFHSAAADEARDDQIDFLSDMPMVAIRRAANQSIANATFDNVDWDTEDLDLFGMFAPTSDTVTFRHAGLYYVDFYASWAANATGVNEVILRVNGVTDFCSGTSPGSATVRALNASSFYNAAVGDTLVAIVRQTSGGALNMTGRMLVKLLRSS